jgi:hypothetical protein
LEWPIQGFHYRYQTISLATDGQRIREECAKLGIGFLVCDSFSFAAGNEPETPGAATSTMNTLRSLGANITRLGIGHISKEMATTERKGRRRMYGGMPYENGARCVWDVRRDSQLSMPEVVSFDDEGAEVYSEENEVRLALYNTKANDKYVEKPIGLMVKFTGPGMPAQIVRTDVPLTGELSNGLTMNQRITAVLVQYKFLPVYRIAEELEQTPDMIEKALKRNESFLKLDREWNDPITGRKVDMVYALKDRARSEEVG